MQSYALNANQENQELQTQVLFYNFILFLVQARIFLSQKLKIYEKVAFRAINVFLSHLYLWQMNLMTE